MIDVTCFNWVKMIQKSKLEKYEKYVAHYLSTYMNLNNDIAWPSQSRMYGEMGISQATLNRALNKLEKEGWLTRERGNPTTCTRYQINIPTDAVRDIALGGTLPETVGTPQERVGTLPERVGVLSDRDTNNNVNNKRITNRFEEFWNLYPKKTDKKNARAKFSKLSSEEQAEAIKFLDQKPFRDTEVRFVPHPTTFINGARWEDELPTTRGFIGI